MNKLICGAVAAVLVGSAAPAMADPGPLVTFAWASYMAKHPARGAVVVVATHGSVYTYAFGTRDAANNPMQTYTPIGLASNTKPFVAATLSLSERIGAFSPSTTLNSVVPRTMPIAGSATLRDLASMYSGLPRDRPGGARPTSRDQTYDGLHYCGTWSDACTTPERSYTYSNYGFDVLGAVIADDWDYDSWNDLADDLVFTPLGMNHTCREAGNCFPDWPTSHAHAFNFAGNEVSLPGLPNAATAEGGEFSTGHDIGQWLLFLTGFSPNPIDSYLAGVPAIIAGTLPNGHGWSFDFSSTTFYDGASVRVRNKGGYFTGLTSYLSIADSRQAAVFVFVNRDPDPSSPDSALRDDFVYPILKSL